MHGGAEGTFLGGGDAHGNQQSATAIDCCRQVVAVDGKHAGIRTADGHITTGDIDGTAAGIRNHYVLPTGSLRMRHFPKVYAFGSNAKYRLFRGGGKADLDIRECCHTGAGGRRCGVRVCTVIHIAQAAIYTCNKRAVEAAIGAIIARLVFINADYQVAGIIICKGGIQHDFNPAGSGGKLYLAAEYLSELAERCPVCGAGKHVVIGMTHIDHPIS